jgi:hypothetical protein
VIDRAGEIWAHAPRWLRVAARLAGIALYYLFIGATLGVPLLLLTLYRRRLPGDVEVPAQRAVPTADGNGAATNGHAADRPERIVHPQK